MKILSVHFKGGVGKSTTAIHVVGVLSAEGPTLLVDGDRQITSYRFFNGGSSPSSFEPIDAGNNVTIVPLNQAGPTTGHDLSARIRKILKFPHEHIVFDTTPDPFHANQILAELEPDLILIPIKYDDEGGHVQLQPLLETIGRARAIGISSRVKIIPIGDSEYNIRQYISGSTPDFEIADPIPADQLLFGSAVYRDYNYAWNYPNQGYLYSTYQRIALSR
jgi:chromosome partitioning protein